MCRWLCKKEYFSDKDKIISNRLEWNTIRLVRVYYQIDSTWEEGNVNGRMSEKYLDEFYFCHET